MEIVRPEHNWFHNHLVKQPIQNFPYRPSNFIVRRDVDNGILLYNSVTGCLLFFESEDEINSNLSVLIEYWFYLPSNSFNECDWVDFLRNKRINYVSKQGINSYVIMTTLDCNARCFYCYEKGVPHITMNSKIATSICDFIKRHSTDTIKLTWFGGEPLINSSVIDLICQRLTEYGGSFFSTIITNGLLLTSETIGIAIKKWNLKRVQITLDGTEKIYLRTKSYIDSNGNEFQIVLDNIDCLLRSEIAVTIRLNQDKHNTDDLLTLVDILHSRFGYSRHLKIYNHLLFNFDGEYTQEQIDDFYKLGNKLNALGYESNHNLPYGMIIHQCMADSDQSLVITPSGQIGKCEHFTDDKMVGSIFSDELDLSTINMWKEKYDTTEECYSCPLYPTCIRLKKCPNQKIRCTDFYRKNRLDSINMAMENYYKKWKSKDKSIT
ncbi:MAG: SPASM domain-containing protein [Bacteroidales bacterium]|nr:SPASM domain-containing protein [Bacteroidales bacterium]